MVAILSRPQCVEILDEAWRHQAITWTNADSSSVRSSDIHLRASSQEITQPSITEIIWKIKYLNFIQIPQGPMS